MILVKIRNLFGCLCFAIQNAKHIITISINYNIILGSPRNDQKHLMFAISSKIAVDTNYYNCFSGMRFQ